MIVPFSVVQKGFSTEILEGTPSLIHNCFRGNRSEIYIHAYVAGNLGRSPPLPHQTISISGHYVHLRALTPHISRQNLSHDFMTIRENFQGKHFQT